MRVHVKLSVCITFHALMYGVLALLDRHARVVASSRVISTSDGTHVLGTWKVIHTDNLLPSKIRNWL
jgi:hypothetical protein